MHKKRRMRCKFYFFFLCTYELTFMWKADWESKSLPCRVSLYC